MHLTNFRTLQQALRQPWLYICTLLHFRMAQHG